VSLLHEQASLLLLGDLAGTVGGQITRPPATFTADPPCATNPYDAPPTSTCTAYCPPTATNCTTQPRHSTRYWTAPHVNGDSSIRVPTHVGCPRRQRTRAALPWNAAVDDRPRDAARNDGSVLPDQLVEVATVAATT